jgi:hypothetical protein
VFLYLCCCLDDDNDYSLQSAREEARHRQGLLSATAPYQTAMVFTENAKNYWLVVRQDALLKFQELKRGDTIELFLIKMGNIRLEPTDEKLESVIVVEKYVKQ